jgi:hypothetical protein
MASLLYLTDRFKETNTFFTLIKDNPILQMVKIDAKKKNKESIITGINKDEFKICWVDPHKKYSNFDNIKGSIILNKNHNLMIEGNCKAKNLITTSDIRLKKNINKLENSLENITKLDGVYFNWKEKEDEKNKRNIGLIAQKVDEIFPELIDNSFSSKGILYQGLTSIILESIKEQYSQIKIQQEKIQQIKKNLDLFDKDK